MYTRLITTTIKPESMNEFRTKLNSEFLPRIQKQPGFVENIESLDPATGQFTCLTMWRERADVERYDKGLFQEITGALGSLLQTAPEVRTLPVENSSVHHIRTGKAAA